MARYTLRRLVWIIPVILLVAGDYVSADARRAGRPVGS